MSSNSEGGKKSHVTLRKRLGEKKYRDKQQEWGAKGGKAHVPKGFAITRLHLKKWRKVKAKYSPDRLEEVSD